MAADAGELKARATLDNTEFLSALKDMVNQVNQNTQDAAEGIGKITKAFGEMAEAVGLGEVAKKLGEFASECIDAATQVNKLQASFNLLSGSAEKGREIFEDLENLGLHSMFDFADVLAPAAKQMMLLGASAEEAGATMHGLVDAASALKQGPEWITQVSDAIANMQSHLVASQRDMKALQQSGIDAWGALADQLGVSVSQAQEMVKKGMVTASTVTDAVNASLEKFQGAAALSADTWKGAMHTLSEEGEKAEAAIGNSILAILNDFAPVLQSISSGIEQLIGWWKGLSEPVQTAVLALGAAITAIVAISAALPVLALGGEALIAAFTGPVAPIVAVVAALGLLGKWIYDEWPAIKAVFETLWEDISAAWSAKWQTIKDWWSGISQWFQSIVNDLAPVLQFLETLFSPLVALWKAEWDLVKSVLSAAWDWIKAQVQGVVDTVGKVVSAVTQFFTGMPGDTEMSRLAAAWKKGTDEIAAQAAATKAHAQTVKDDAAAMTAAAKERQKDEADKLAADNRAKAAAAEQKKAADEAAKEAAAALKYNEDLAKSYEALYKIAPDVAAQFADMFGGINAQAINAAKTIGKPWADMSAAQQQLVQDTLVLGAAFTTLGVSSAASLEGAATKAETAYTTIANSGKATAGDLTAAMDKVYAANKKVADQQNTDVKDAYDQSKISADEYYGLIIQRAQEAADAASAALDKGLATNEDVAAKEKILADDRAAYAKNTQDAYNAAMNAIGEKTQQQLDDAATQWSKYAQTISDKLGPDSKPAIEASIKLVQSLIDEATALGKAPPDFLTDWLKGLNAQLVALQTPAEAFAADMKKLGVNTTQDATDGIAKMAAALADAKLKSDGSLQSQKDLDQGTQKLDQTIQSLVDTYNTKWKAALAAGDITQTQYNQHAVEGAQQVLQAFTTLGDDAPGKIEEVNAATKVLDGTINTLQKSTMKDAQKAFTDLGVQSHDAMQQMATDAATDFAKVAASANENGTTYMNAWINAQKKIYDAQLADGTSLSSAQKEDMAKMVAKRDEFLAAQQSAWATAYGQVKTTIGTAFDDLTKTIITGKGSFGDLMTNMWQSLAETALNAFMKPLKDAVTNFIANELANLLGDKGLGGVLTSLTDIGKKSTEVFTTGATTAAEGGATAAESGATTAESGATSAAGGAASAASSVFGIIGAIGSAITAISSVISNFQMAHEIDILKSIEHNTRYTMMYVGDRADGGILGVLFKIDEEIAWGANTKANEAHKDLFLDWSTPALDAMQNTQHMLESIGAYIPDIKGRLEDILAVDMEALSVMKAGFQQVTVTVNAGTLTLADAARQLGNQIATNLTTQLTAVRG
jgi:tape measure domain-containing protein